MLSSSLGDKFFLTLFCPSKRILLFRGLVKGLGNHGKILNKAAVITSQS